MYAWIRLIAGIGLAGELGAGITLISETMGKENAHGTMIVATTGVLGAVADFTFLKLPLGETHYWWYFRIGSF